VLIFVSSLVRTLSFAYVSISLVGLKLFLIYLGCSPPLVGWKVIVNAHCLSRISLSLELI